MSRAEIDMLLIDIDLTDQSIEAFRSDARGFVDAWEAAGRDRATGRWEGGVLTDDERRAFIDFDYATLYRMGAHPFLLWQMVRSVVGDSMPVGNLIAEYNHAVEPHGHPTFGT